NNHLSNTSRSFIFIPHPSSLIPHPSSLSSPTFSSMPCIERWRSSHETRSASYRGCLSHLHPCLRSEVRGADERPRPVARTCRRLLAHADQVRSGCGNDLDDR